MKRKLTFLIVLLTLLFAFTWLFAEYYYLRDSVHAQTTTTPLAITVAGLHASCLPVAVGVTTFCFASDGLWQSLNGAAYVQLGVAAPAGVTSVNGKTGVVVLGATTTSTTTVQ